MELSQHPLAAAFPTLSAEQIEGMKEGVIPMTQSEVEAMTATAWFRSLTASQRAAYVVTWMDWPERGSNQYVTKISANSPRAAALATRSAITKARA
ncbi:hypothetical protein SOM08_06100 [Hydrogenophaga sp. SNF1]|uniref:hypothetical protein n=1 Tax=Hydrogenophaga sp. SNF1 TaxID=3098762 RepID=UPI002ACC0C3E|nr:hypothetical protein [Hydrogenophaga sp. SNF1]WQB84883.1 hypothetical protein SOM08_06100 [Hydrogenophaga sp. SNF1]